MYEEKDTKVDLFKKNQKSSTIKKIIGITLVIGVLIGAVYILSEKSERARAILGVKPKTEQETVRRYLAQLSQLMIIPKDDTPVLATVEDPEALIKQQAFFQGSEKGDVVLIFPKTSRAILFSPKKDIIINAGPVISGDNNSEQQP